jgi:glucose/arabinose dehydrogenase
MMRTLAVVGIIGLAVLAAAASAFDPAGMASRAAAPNGAPALVDTVLEVPAPLKLGPLAPGRRLRLAAGFRIGVLAVVPGVRFGTVAPDGRLVVSQMREGRVLAIDATGRVQVLASGLNLPHGVAYRNGVLHVAETGRVDRVPRPGEVVPIVPDLPTGGGHVTRTLGFGPDRGMYVSVGSSCNVCEERDPRRAAILRFDPDGTHPEIYATGLRNAVGFAWDPATGALWAVVNGRDWLGDDLPPDILVKVVRGGFYGWPYCYGTRIPDPDFHKPERCREMVPPALEIQAHSAPLGMAFARGATLPPRYQGGVFVAFHGSWNRSVPTGYKLVYVPFANGTPAGAVEDFATGWLQSDGTAWGRPVDPVIAPDGRLFLTDDRTGAIYVIRYQP